jgi:subtilase family serine protease
MSISSIRRALIIPLVAGTLVATVADLGLADQPGVTTTVYGAASTSAAHIRQACGTPAPGRFQCLADFLPGSSSASGVHADTAAPTGYSPAQLQDAYKLTAAVAAGKGAGETVAIVDAYDDPNAEADLAVYRSTFGLKPCTTADGCFTKESETGSTTALPAANGSWSVEISLDLDMVSAACPGCRILLVEATQPSLADLAAAENLAAGTAGVVAVSNSWAGAESGVDYQYASAFDHPGVAITVSSGDSGYQLQAAFPGTLSTVISVGGTELDPAPGTARGWSETAWNTAGQDGAAAGAWCSAWVDRPAWQRQTVCSGRTSSDVSADADPYTGPSIYDSVPYQGTVYGWLRGGGTSAAAPFIAAVYALAGNTASIDDASRLYTRHRDLFDVSSGNDVMIDSCRQSLICNAVKGYDAVTGNGTPDGLAAF